MGATPFSTVSVMSDKAQAEHNESALPPIADMKADIDFYCFGPGAVISITSSAQFRTEAE